MSDNKAANTDGTKAADATGTTSILIYEKDGMVVLDFGSRPVKWLAFDPATGRKFAQDIYDRCALIAETILCGCNKSDAWRCAVDKEMKDIACPCPCHRERKPDPPKQ